MSDPIILGVSELGVFSWSPGKDGEGVPCTEVHIVSKVTELEMALVMRLKSREACDQLVAALIEHRDFVFGKGEV